MGKIIDELRAAIAQNRRFFALEFFPPKTEAGVANLYNRMERMGSAAPLFVNVTWGDGGTTAADTIEIASTAQHLLGLEMQVSVTGYGATEAQMKEWLQQLLHKGIHNLCLLRGDPLNPVHRANQEKRGAADPAGDFPHAVDLVKFVRAQYGTQFGVSVAGYPEGHADCPDYHLGLQHLKAKVDAGADLVISQMIYDAGTFLKFCADCREVGILCPILPGIMPIHSYRNFRRCMVHTSGTSNQLRAGTEAIDLQLHQHRNDDAEVRAIGKAIVANLIKALFRNGVRGVYFFTMNLETVITEILQELSLVDAHRDMPWRPAADEERRRQESVRPIHWASRPKSYLARTSQWDEFPNGRWGSTQSPAFREDATYHTSSGGHATLLLTSRERHCHQFASVATIGDVANLFLAFLDGNGVLPWSDELTPEVDVIMDRILRPLNQRGFLTINSQPPVNAAKSTNKIVGWGPPGGYVYQKQYLEFFCSRANADVVFATFDRFPSLTYMAVDSQGAMVRCNLEEHQEVTAVTWGVFAGREILQPTISSRESFHAWAPEAFHLWGAPFFDRADIPPVIGSIMEHWVLVNVVDNEFIQRPTPLDAAIGALCAATPIVATGPHGEAAMGPIAGAASAPSGLSTPPVKATSPSSLAPAPPRRTAAVKRFCSQASVSDLAELGVPCQGEAAGQPQQAQHQRVPSWPLLSGSQ